jgi:hypothetical protein
MDRDADRLLSSIKDLAKRDPEAFGALFLQFVTKLLEVDRAAYDYVMAGVMVRTLHGSGFMVSLNVLKQKLAVNDVVGATEALGAIENWIAAMEHLASRERVEDLLEQEQVLYVM